jgi:hypothetical protein
VARTDIYNGDRTARRPCQANAPARCSMMSSPFESP